MADSSRCVIISKATARQFTHYICLGSAVGVAVVNRTCCLTDQTADTQLAGHNISDDLTKACAVCDQAVVRLYAADTAHRDRSIQRERTCADINIAPTVSDQTAGFRATCQTADRLLCIALIGKCEIRSRHGTVINYAVVCQNTSQPAHRNFTCAVGVVKFINLHIEILNRAAVYHTEEADSLILCRIAGLATVDMAYGVASAVKRAGEAVVLAMICRADRCPCNIAKIQICRQRDILASVILTGVDCRCEVLQALYVVDNIRSALRAIARSEDTGILLDCVLQRVLYGFLDRCTALRRAGNSVYICHSAVITPTEQLLNDGDCLLPVAWGLLLFGDINAADIAVFHGYGYRNLAAVTRCRAGVSAVLVGAGRRGDGLLLEQSGNADCLVRHGKGIAGNDCIICHQRTALELIALFRRYRQGNGIACLGNAPVCRYRAVLHRSDGDAVHGRSGGTALVQHNVVYCDRTALLFRRFKHKCKLRRTIAERCGNSNTALAGNILRFVTLINCAHMILGIPQSCPRLTLVLSRLYSKLERAGRKCVVRCTEIKGQLHVVLHVDLGQNQLFILCLIAHEVLVAHSGIALKICVADYLPCFKLVLRTRAFYRPAVRHIALVEVLMDAVRQGNCLCLEGSRDGVVLDNVGELVGGLCTLRFTVYLNVLDLVALGRGDGERLAFALDNGNCTVRRNAAALTSRCRNGVGGRLGRVLGGTAGCGEFYIVDQNCAAASVAILGLVTECKLHAISLELCRNFNRYICRLISIGHNGFGQLINNACSIPNRCPCCSIFRRFQCKCSTATAQSFFNLIYLVCTKLETHHCSLISKI